MAHLAHAPCIAAFVVLTATACGDKPADAAVHEGSRGVVQTPEPEDPPYAPPVPSGDVFGHVRIADPFALVAKASEKLAPADRAGDLTIDHLREAARAAAKSRAAEAVAIHLDPGRPLACALLDPIEHAIPLACVLGFSGGFEQLAQDLGGTGHLTTVAPDAARYDFDGIELRLHALGPDVVVAFDDTAFAKSREYLEALTRRGAVWDVELTLHAATAVAHFRERLDELGANVIRGVASLRDDPLMLAIMHASARELAVLTPLVADEGTPVLAELLDVGAQIHRLELGARLDDNGVLVALTATAKPDSRLHGAFESADPLPAALFDWVPRHTWLLALDRVVVDAIVPKTEALAERMFAAVLADALGQPVESVEAALGRFSEENAALYDDARAFAMFNGPGTWGGAVLVRPLRAGGSGRDAWLAWGRAMTPSTLLGPKVGAELDNIVRWGFEENAMTIEGVAIDRFAITPAPRFVSRVSASLGSDADFAKEIVAWVASKPALVAVDRFEHERAAAFVLAPVGAPDYAERVIAARNGTNDGTSRATHAQLDVLLARHPRPRFVLAFSGADLASFVHAALPPDLVADVPKSVGRELGDVALATWITAPSAGGELAWTAELHVTQPIVDFVRSRILRSPP